MVLNFVQYDAKLIRPLDTVPKAVNHALLEHLIQVEQHRVGDWQPQFVVAQIYEGVTAADLGAFRDVGLELVLASGKWAYFTDAQTASLVHHQVALSSDAIAYGSQFLSNANASTVRSQARLLVLDDTASIEVGLLPQIRQQLGIDLDEADLREVHRKLGDCYSLISSGLAHRVAYSIRQQPPHNPNTSPFQFRAGSPEIPGVIKGTCRVSEWCDRLQVDAILSLSSFKATHQPNGDKPHLVGAHAVSDFFFANKTYTTVNQQKRGLQPALVTPETTQREVLPELVEKAIAAAQIQANPQSATTYYLNLAEQRQSYRDNHEVNSIEDEDTETIEDSYVDTIYEILKADSFGQMHGHPKVMDAIAKVLHHEWMDAVTVGVYAPSAIAQPHTALKPWECCFRELPHGALVALYRSPLGNIAGIGTFINNVEQLRETDAEAFQQQGVVYLNPWAAANVLITDFDGDRNAIVPGYEAISPGATVYRLQEQLQEISDSLAAYEAAQALFRTAIQDAAIFTASASPVFVAEVLEKNRPEVRPIAVNKEPKIERQGTIEECAIHAANNPIGIVANLGMKIDSLYWDIAYLAPEHCPAYLQQVCSHYAKVLERSDIPQPENYASLLSSGNLRFSDRIQQIVHEGRQVLQRPERERIKVAEPVLQQVRALLWDIKAIIAMNLQRAVDAPKSAREVAWELHAFAAALGKYKENSLLTHRKDADLYQPLKERETTEAARILPTTTGDPVAQIAKQVNQHYQDVVLTPRSRDSFLPLFPTAEQGGFSQEQAKTARSWVQTYNAAIQRASQAQARAETEIGPSFLIQSVGDRQLRVVNLTQCDPEGNSPIWVAARTGATMAFRAELNQNWQTQSQYPYVIALAGSSQVVGFISPESVQANQAWLSPISAEKSIPIPIDRIKQLTFEPQLTIAQANAEITATVKWVAQQVQLLTPLERTQLAAALWHNAGQHLVIQALHPELCQQLQTLQTQTMTVIGLQHSTNFHRGASFPSEPLPISIAVETNSESPIAGRTVLQVEGKTLGPFSADSYQLPAGTCGEARILPEFPAVVKAALSNGITVKVNQVQSHYFTNQVWRDEAVELGMKRREREGSQWADLVLMMRDSTGQLQDFGIVSTAKDRQAVEAAFRQASPILKRETTIPASLTSDIVRQAVVQIIPERLQLALNLGSEKKAVDQPRANPLADLSALNAATARHMQKDIAMAEVATQFIGKSAAPDHTPSSTRNYELAWGSSFGVAPCANRANTGCYAPTDVVMVSGSGPWRGVSQAAIQQVFQTHYQPLLDQAIAAQAQFVVGNAAGTDQLVQQYLRSHGYTLEWNSATSSSGYLKATSPLNSAVSTVAESGQGMNAPATSFAGYCPSRGELFQWYQAYQIRAQTHSNEPQKLQQDREGMAYVKSIRLRQKSEELEIIPSPQAKPIYRDSQGKTVDISHHEFRNPAVVLSLEDYRRMQKAIQYLQRQTLPTHLPVARLAHGHPNRGSAGSHFQQS